MRRSFRFPARCSFKLHTRGFHASPVWHRLNHSFSEMRLYKKLLKRCIISRSLQEGKQLHAIVAERGYDHFAFYGNLLINLYSVCGCVKEAEAAFLKTSNPSDTTNSLIVTAFSRNGDLQSAEKIFFRIKDKGPRSAQNMIRAYCDHGKLQLASRLFDLTSERDWPHWSMMIEGFARNGLIQSALHWFERMPYRGMAAFLSVIAMFIDAGELECARAVFDHIPEKRCGSCNKMIAAYARSGRINRVLEIFRVMDLDGIEPDQTSFIGVFDGCANASALRDGQIIAQELLVDRKWDLAVLTSAINMFGKCGKLDQAEELFDRVIQKDAVLWTTMISAYAQNGDHPGARRLFTRMVLDGAAQPSDVTFVTVLAACCQEGDLGAAIELLRGMSGEFGVAAAADHYICLIDQFGRCGDLESAEDLLLNMPFEPDPVAWIIFLSACRNQRDLSRALFAVTNVVELDPSNTALHSLMIPFTVQR